MNRPADSTSDQTDLLATLPAFLSFRTGKDLIRLGKDNDGGYLVSAADVAKSKALISLGINEDWSFEEDFHRLNSSPIYAYDASIGHGHFLRRIVEPLRYPPDLKLMKRRRETYRRYRAFFGQPHVRHIRRYVNSSKKGRLYRDMSAVLAEVTDGPIFLKIDVEGSEYSFLDELLAQQHRIRGLAIELHACHNRIDQIERFVDGFDLNLVHIHANNNPRAFRGNEMPNLLEMTFSRYGDRLQNTLLPHPLDMRNLPRVPAINLQLAAE